ncbi:unnamed protein product [Rotaria socialis]|uniref:Prokaryotic glutathione synthetase ATP-binding domain-containing protein n=1 Tax=Rotaria socialis TaxID=392032 RepID=A0A821SUQ3_9BILA|nr:unnamed protein product [Rotaria socialis]CAF4516830.1 unnamed protein product [Rotaria socialis]CAF4860254.1 unnamed protein product [Rotaria socialis]
MSPSLKIALEKNTTRLYGRQTHVVSRPILSNIGPSVVVILTPELKDTTLANLWRLSFHQLRSQFQVFGVRAIAAPWIAAPLFLDSSHSFIYIANLACGNHQLAEQWNAWLHAWPETTKLINSSSLLLWNTRKTYLQDLQKAGIPVIPTLYVEHIDEKTLINAAAYFAMSDLIVKPQVGASSFNMIRVLVDSTDCISVPKSLSTFAAVAELTRLGTVDSMMMLHPFMTSVVQEGEISVFVFGEKVGHAVRTKPQSNDYRIQFEYDGITTTLKEISPEMLELVHNVIVACPETPVYARVDIMRNTETGCLCVSELELIEPGLFLEHAPDGGMTFVRAILQGSSINTI